ncbi:hypothetical protein Rhopal_002635-T1 [Rhodotorula paludigena]|uniref:MFS general substrate transporter n=1 Tax=Rhodotorula paludigena TaxID=86838 RepID=A0AAV5GLV5_9BASI|nr:hypothetical protein Rhopal_002635-T1 [Rhodotorula paludigena]
MSFDGASQGSQRPLDPLEIDDSPIDVGEAGARELAPADRGRGAWEFVVAAWLLETFLFGYSYAFATLLVYFQSHEPWSQESVGALSAIGTTQLALMFMLPTIIVTCYRRYPEWVKPATWTGVGTGNALLFSPVWIYLSEWWVVRRGLAFGIVLSGIGFGGFAFPFILNALLEKVGFAWMCRVMALILAAVLSIANFLMKPRIPRPKPALGQRGPWIAIDLKFLYDPIFLWMSLATILASLSYLPVVLFLPVYASSFTTSTTQQNLVLAIFNLLAAVGTALWGRVTDVSYSLTVVGCGFLGALVSLTAWGLADTLAKVYGFGVLFALTAQMVPAWGGAARDVAKQNPNVSTMAFCLFSVVRGIGSIIMPIVSEALYNPDELYDGDGWGARGFHKMIIFVGVTAALSGLAGLGLGWTRARKQAQL